MSERIFENRVNEIYANGEATAAFEPYVKDLERKLIDNCQFGLTKDFLMLMFSKPEITQQLQFVAAYSVDSFLEAVSAQNKKLVSHFGFYVEHCESEGFHATVAPEFPIDTDPSLPTITIEEDSKSQAMVVVHALPPIDKVLVPSVITPTSAKNDLSQFAGGMHSFLRMREMGKESLNDPGREIPEFIERPILLMIQDSLDRGVTKLLFIREKQDLTVLDEQKYLDLLWHMRPLMGMAKSEAEVQQLLTDSGFLSSYVELPTEQFYDYPLLSLDQISQIATDLELE